MQEAIENDTDLLTEVQSFWIEPASHVPLWGKDDISWLAVAVVRWLRVRQFSLCPSLLKVIPNDHLVLEI